MFWLFILLQHADCDSTLFLNISVMPRSDTLSRGQDANAGSRGFKIDPQYMLDNSAEVTKESDELIHKLISDAIEFFKIALKLKQPVKKSGILLSRTCEYTTGKCRFKLFQLIFQSLFYTEVNQLFSCVFLFVSKKQKSFKVLKMHEKKCAQFLAESLNFTSFLYIIIEDN